MRKLKLQVQITIDGFISGVNGEMDWMLFEWSQDLLEYVKELTEPVDTILLGRKLAEGFIPHWENVIKNPNDPEYLGGVKLTKTPKIVFSKTYEKSIWNNTKVATGEITEEVLKIKQQNGNDIIVYGGGSFVSSLITKELIDEIHLFINPVIIGKGMPIFQEISKKQNFKAIQAKHFECGIVVLTYKSVN